MWTALLCSTLVALAILGAAWMWWPRATIAQAKGQAEVIENQAQKIDRLEQAQVQEWKDNHEQDKNAAATVSDRQSAIDFLRGSFSRSASPGSSTGR